MHNTSKFHGSSPNFGTSGLRGLAVELGGDLRLPKPVLFAEMLKEDCSALCAGGRVLVRRDLREQALASCYSVVALFRPLR